MAHKHKIKIQLLFENSKVKPSVFPATALNGFRKNAANTIARSVATKLNRIASARNCFINCFFSEPKTLRMPTSLARFADCAVERFIKLTQASTIINKATAEKIYTYFISLSEGTREPIPAECK